MGPLQHLLPGKMCLELMYSRFCWYQNVRCHVSDYMCLLVYICVSGGGDVVDSQHNSPGPAPNTDPPLGNVALVSRIK